MATTEKRITLALTKADVKELNDLCTEFGENQSQVIKRALLLLYHMYFKKEVK